MSRPKIEDFFPKSFTIDEMNDLFLNNGALYRYMQSLDSYIDELESQPTLTEDKVMEIALKALNKYIVDIIDQRRTSMDRTGSQIKMAEEIAKEIIQLTKGGSDHE